MSDQPTVSGAYDGMNATVIKDASADLVAVLQAKIAELEAKLNATAPAIAPIPMMDTPNA